VIASFADRKTERFFREGKCPVEWQSFVTVARRKLIMLDSVKSLDDLRYPPGNRLEALKGDRKGQWSIRINQQWRVCFEWGPSGPGNVEIVDYH
jgi:proteic killer suppression protein